MGYSTGWISWAERVFSWISTLIWLVLQILFNNVVKGITQVNEHASGEG